MSGIIDHSQRMNQENEVPFLPEEIIFQILIRLPAEFLYHCGKYVCKTWREIIRDPRFKERHLLFSRSSVFIQESYESFDASFIESEEGEVRVKPLERQFPGQMLASCEGVSLFYYHHCLDFLYIVNPVTKKAIIIPFPSLIHVAWIGYFRMARIPHTGEFKVLCRCKDQNVRFHWLVLTVGTNATWRRIDTIPGEDSIDLEKEVCSLVSVEGVVYCATIGIAGVGRLLAIDLRDETIHNIIMPYGSFNGLIEMRKNLYCMMCTLEYFEGGGTYVMKELEIYILEDLHSSRWIKVYEIETNMEAEAIWFRGFWPVAYLDDGHMILRIPNGDKHSFVAYDLKTREITAINLGIVAPNVIVIYKSSLASW
ncbi:hypothetical protein L1049_019832 [Liquidambar formosana]|uniref:F-box domain-containing protein n=1 Tax=Liquidambar formosana TaxID=63359 RepID=A0AAP0X5J6_LIQFO